MKKNLQRRWSSLLLFFHRPDVLIRTLLIIAFVLVVTIFLAFRPQELTVRISGIVRNEGAQPLSSAMVYVLKDLKDTQNPANMDTKELNLDSRYQEPSNQNGEFKLQFNATEGSVVWVLCMRQGYKVAYEYVVPSNERRQLQKDIILKSVSIPSTSPSILTQDTLEGLRD